MRTNQILKTILFCSMGSSLTLAQPLAPTKAAAKPKTITQLKTQKYNGYGLANTKFKKIKVDMTKKKSTTELPSAAPSVASPTVSITPPKSSLQPNNTSEGTSATKAEAKPPEKFWGFSGSYDLSYNTQAEKQADNTQGQYLTHEITPKVKIGEFSLLGDFFYYDDLKNPSANEWADSAIIFMRKPFELGKYLTLTPATTLGLPLSKASREDSGIKYSLGASAGLGLNTKNMGLEWLAISYSLAYTKYATEFNTKPNGDPSADYRIRQRFNLGFSFNEKFSFKSRLQYDSGYSNQGVVRNSYLHYEIFNYKLLENFDVYAGHATAGSPVYSITDSGSDILFENDLKFYDPKKSEFTLGFTLSF